MATILQIELRNYINNHGFEAIPQDTGVVLLMPVTLTDGRKDAEWDYVETYWEARRALGY